MMITSDIMDLKLKEFEIHCIFLFRGGAEQDIDSLANDHLEWLATCKWSSGGFSLLQMIIWRIRPLANDHPDDSATCKLSSRWFGLLQMSIRRIWALANDHLEDVPSCKWSSVRSGYSYKWSSGGTSLLQIDHPSPRHPNHLSQDPDSILRTFLEQFVLIGLGWSYNHSFTQN